MHQGFYYLAIPYQGTEEQQEARTELSFTAATECLRQGIHLFAPLIYVNTIADRLGLNLEQRRVIVMPYLLDFLKVSKGLILVTADGWKTSWGIKQELLCCVEHSIPVFKIAPEQLYEELTPLLEVPLNQQALQDLLG